LKKKVRVQLWRCTRFDQQQEEKSDNALPLKTCAGKLVAALLKHREVSFSGSAAGQQVALP
jgi:hypothetical protein